MLRTIVAVPLTALILVCLSCSNADGPADGAAGSAAGSPPQAATPPRLADSKEPWDPGFAKLIRERASAVERSPESAEAWGSLGLAYDAHDGIDGDFVDPAVQCYSRAAALAPDVFRWPYLAGSLVYSTSQMDALEWLDAAFAADTELARQHAPLFVRHGLGRLGLGDVEGAREDFESATSIDASLVLGWMGLARVALADDDPTAALIALGRASEAGPVADEIHGLFAEAHRRLGDDESAAAALARLQDGGRREQLPDRYRDEVRGEGISVKWAQRLSRSLMQARRFDDAVATWERVIVQADQIEAHFALADLLISGGRLEDASAVHERLALRLKGSNAPARDKAKLEFQIGVVLLAQGNTERAVEQFEAALVLDESYALARGNLGSVLCGQGAVDDGLGHLRRACAELEPENSMQLNLLRALENAALWEELEEALDRFEEASGKEGRTCFMRGRSLAGRRQFELAAAAFGEAAELEPENESAVTNQARALGLVGDEAGAVVVLHDAYRRLSHPSIRATAPASGLRVATYLAWTHATTVHEEQADGRVALRFATEVLASSPENPEYLDLMGAALAADGSFELAVEHAEQAIRALSELPDDQAPRNRTALLREIESRRDTYKEGRRWTR